MSSNASVILDSSTQAARKRGYAPDAFARHVACGLGAAAAVLLVGSIIDLGILWVLQRQPGPQWEFVAVTNTLESVPRFVFGLGFLYATAHALRTTSLTVYRVLGAALIGTGLMAALLGGLALTDYLILRPDTVDAGALLLRSSAVKSVALSAFYTVLLLPLGLLSLRRPRTS